MSYFALINNPADNVRLQLIINTDKAVDISTAKGVLKFKTLAETTEVGTEISATTVSATTQYYWTTFVRGNVSNGSSNCAYYAIYTSKLAAVNVRVAAYTPYDNTVNYPTSSSTLYTLNILYSISYTLNIL